MKPATGRPVRIGRSSGWAGSAAPGEQPGEQPRGDLVGAGQAAAVREHGFRPAGVEAWRVGRTRPRRRPRSVAGLPVARAVWRFRASAMSLSLVGQHPLDDLGQRRGGVLASGFAPAGAAPGSRRVRPHPALAQQRGEGPRGVARRVGGARAGPAVGRRDLLRAVGGTAVRPSSVMRATTGARFSFGPIGCTGFPVNREASYVEPYVVEGAGAQGAGRVVGQGGQGVPGRGWGRRPRRG